jgi:hypothetical protein
VQLQVPYAPLVHLVLPTSPTVQLQVPCAPQSTWCYQPSGQCRWYYQVHHRATGNANLPHSAPGNANLPHSAPGNTKCTDGAPSNTKCPNGAHGNTKHPNNEFGSIKCPKPCVCRWYRGVSVTGWTLFLTNQPQPTKSEMSKLLGSSGTTTTKGTCSLCDDAPVSFGLLINLAKIGQGGVAKWHRRVASCQILSSDQAISARSADGGGSPFYPGQE